MSFVAINWLAVIVAAVVAFFIGAVWYSFLFRTQWMAAIGAPAADRPATALPRLLAINFSGNLLLAIVLAEFLAALGDVTFASGVTIGLVAWVGFVANVLAVNYAFANRPRLLTLIDGGHWLVVLVVSGAIIGLFG